MDAAGGGSVSARKLMRVLLSFTEQQPLASVSRLASSAGVPVSTAYRYVALLREEGLLEDGGPGLYRLTPRVVALARAARAARGSLTSLARPLLEWLVEQTSETAVFMQRMGWSVVCVDLVESRQAVRLSFQVGQPRPLWAGSAAKVLLAGSPAEERSAYRRSLGPDARPPTDDDLEQIRQQGWAESFGEVDPGIWGTAAAVASGGEVAAALGVAGPLYRLDESARERIIVLVRRAAGELAAQVSALEA
jgi:DNA-binding IclR family transcriptional regulator